MKHTGAGGGSTEGAQISIGSEQDAGLEMNPSGGQLSQKREAEMICTCAEEGE